MGTILINSLLKNYFEKYFSFEFRWPWNQQTLPGWIINALLSVIVTGCFPFVNLAFLTLFISICEYHRAFFEMFQMQINKMNEIARAKPLRKIDLKKALVETISFHITVKEYEYLDYF